MLLDLNLKLLQYLKMNTDDSRLIDAVSENMVFPLMGKVYEEYDKESDLYKSQKFEIAKLISQGEFITGKNRRPFLVVSRYIARQRIYRKLHNNWCRTKNVTACNQSGFLYFSYSLYSPKIPKILSGFLGSGKSTGMENSWLDDKGNKIAADSSEKALRFTIQEASIFSSTDPLLTCSTVDNEGAGDIDKLLKRGQKDQIPENQLVAFIKEDKFRYPKRTTR